MARLTQALALQTERGERFNFAISEEYNQAFNFRREVSIVDGFVTIITPSTTITEDASGGELSEVKCLVVRIDADVLSVEPYGVADITTLGEGNTGTILVYGSEYG